MADSPRLEFVGVGMADLQGRVGKSQSFLFQEVVQTSHRLTGGTRIREQLWERPVVDRQRARQARPEQFPGCALTVVSFSLVF